jgi:hypothetical protein
VEGKSALDEAERERHRAYVTGSVVFSVAFLEASINEFFLEAVDGNQITLAGMTVQQMECVANRWEERRNVLGKYQIALAACGVQLFDEDAEPFQGTYGLVKMRNVLIHYRSEWDDELKEHQTVEKLVKGRFHLNGLAHPGSLWFPDQCLGAGCAEWAVNQAAQFVGEFCQRLGIPIRVPSTAT